MNEQTIIKAGTGGIAAYSEYRAQLAALDAENSALVFDYASEKGEKEARSHMHKLRKTKAAVDTARKTEKAASLEYGRLVDAEAKEIIEQLESMIEVHDKPLREIAEREAARKQSILNRLGELCAYFELPPTLTAVQWETHLRELSSIIVDESFDESMAAATKHKKDAISFLTESLAIAMRRESEQAELEKLRKEAAERAQAEREAEIAANAAAKAKAAAEQAAEAQAREVERKAAAEKLAAEAREKVERDRAERAEKAAKETEARLKKEAADKVEAQRKADEKRAADKKHVETVNASASAGLQKALGIQPEEAAQIIVVIASGMIPAISIRY